MARYALLYPVREGHGPHVIEALRQGGDPAPPAGVVSPLRSTTVFANGDLVVRIFEVDCELQEAIELLAAAPPLLSTLRRLAPHLDSATELSGAEGLRSFITDNLMDTVTDRYAEAGSEASR